MLGAVTLINHFCFYQTPNNMVCALWGVVRGCIRALYTVYWVTSPLYWVRGSGTVYGALYTVYWIT